MEEPAALILDAFQNVPSGPLDEIHRRNFQLTTTFLQVVHFLFFR
jgi:hypothetical protein